VAIRRDAQEGDLRTWREVGRHFSSVYLIAQNTGLRPVIHREGRVTYLLLPALPRALDIVAFPMLALFAGLFLRSFGVKTWTSSDPLRSGIVALGVRMVPKTRLIVQVQGQLLRVPGPRFARSARLIEAISRFVARRADTVRVVSRDIAAEAVDAGVEPARIALVPSRCDTRRFDPKRHAADAARMRAGWDAEGARPTIGYLGAFNASKGLDVLIEAMRLLVPRHDVRLVVAGDGPLRWLLEAAQRDAGTPEIRVLDRMTDRVPAFLGAVDIVVVPSWDEGMPRVVLEAMAMGQPVVATRVGGIPDAIQHGTTGVLVPRGDAQALGAALSALLDDPTQRERLGRAARERVCTRFDAQLGWDRLAASLGGAIGAGRAAG
jgi:glycosyltransferase involved in cell wall biosynthesis